MYRVLAVLGSFGSVKSEPVNNCRRCLHPRPGYSLHSASTRLTSRDDPGHGLWSVLQFNYLDPVLFAVVSSSGTEMVTLNLAEEVGINRLDYSGWLREDSLSFRKASLSQVLTRSTSVYWDERNRVWEYPWQNSRTLVYGLGSNHMHARMAKVVSYRYTPACPTYGCLFGRNQSQRWESIKVHFKSDTTHRDIILFQQKTNKTKETN